MADFYEFVDADTSALIDEKIKEYEKMTGRAVNAADPDRLFLLWALNALLIERQMLNYAANQNIPSRASGANLDALAELFCLKERPKARAAQTTVRFHITAARPSYVLIPAGTRITDAGQTLYWATEEDIYVQPGSLYAEGTAVCQTVGTVGNGWEAGTVNTAVDLWDYIDRCENVTVSALGADAADDEEFRKLLRDSMEAYSTAGPRGAYEYHAEAVSAEIADVVAIQPKVDALGNPIDGAGLVELYALTTEGVPAGDTLKAEILEACSDDYVRPLTDSVSVKDPEQVPYTIDFTYYIQRSTASVGARIVEDVEAAVAEYKAWQVAQLGRDINPSKLHSLLMAAGVKRVEIRQPQFRALSDGREGLPPEYASIGTVTIVNGGVEEE